VHCRFDQNALFNYPFVAGDANTLDYFHPSISGQTKLAAVEWSDSFNFTDKTPPVSSATFAVVTGGVQATLSATDNVAVAGIEYKIGTAIYKRYTKPVTVLKGRTITWRAVDVNGNIEATHTHTA
jgi:hypothetical protein